MRIKSARAIQSRGKRAKPSPEDRRAQHYSFREIARSGKIMGQA
jgi:hypothetical protein